MKKNILEKYLIPSLKIASLSFLICFSFVFAQTPTPTPTFNRSAYDAEVERIKKELSNVAGPNKQYYDATMERFPAARPILEKYFDQTTGLPKYDMSDPNVARMWAEDVAVIQNKIMIETVLPAISAQYEQQSREAAAKNEGALKIEQDVRKANAPNEIIPIKATNYATNPRENYYYWFVDGVLQEKNSGLGREYFNYKSPSNIGAKQQIKLITKPLPTAENQTTYNTQMDIRIVDADLNYRGLTYIPAEYKGKANASTSSYVYAEVVPYFPKDSGGFINPGDLSYSWTYIGASSPFSEGVGINSATLRISEFEGDATPIMVDIEDMVNKVKIRKTISINPVRPQVVVETAKKKMGSTKAPSLTRGQISGLSGDCIELKAVPYFFNAKNPISDLDFNWIADQNIGDCSKEDAQKIPNIAYIIMPEKNESASLRPQVSLSISNKKGGTQNASSILSFKIK